MFSFLKRRAFLIVLGFLLIAVFIWFAGPYFAFADYRPLEPVIARLIADRARRRRLVRLGAAAGGCARTAPATSSSRPCVTQSPADADRPSAEAVKLRERFEEAVATLQAAAAQRAQPVRPAVVRDHRRAGFRARRPRCVNSGLKFPLEQRVGKGAVRGVGGTRNCDWWFTDEAVFLDTAGRYTTQDSDAASDSAAGRSSSRCCASTASAGPSTASS